MIGLMALLAMNIQLVLGFDENRNDNVSAFTSIPTRALMTDLSCSWLCKLMVPLYE